MAWTLPQDHEMFTDIESAQSENFSIIENLDQYTFGGVYDAVVTDQYSEEHNNLNPRIYSSQAHAEECIQNLLYNDYIEIEDAVDDYVRRFNTIGWFPSGVMNTYECGNFFVNGNYFEQMSKAFTFMSGIGFVGKYLDSLKNGLEAIKKAEAARKEATKGSGKKPKVFSMFAFFMVLFFLALGCVLVLASGKIPSAFTDLWANLRWLRITAVILTSISILFISAAVKEVMKNGTFLMKLLGNGITTLVLIVALFCFLYQFIALQRFDPVMLLVLGIYFMIYGVALAIDEVVLGKRNVKKQAELQSQTLTEADEAIALAEIEFCSGVEDCFDDIYRYLRFHILWWNTIYKQKPFPSGIAELQRSCNHLLSMYEQYK